MNLQTPLIKAGRIYKMYAAKLEKLGIFTFEDFLFHIPSRYEDYSAVSKIAQVQPGEVVTIQGEVVDINNQYLRGARIKTIQKALIADETGDIELTWFNQPYLTKTLTKTLTISASGRVERFGRKFSIQSPEFEVIFDGNAIHTGRLIPVYPETKGISSKWLRRQVHKLLNQELSIDEYLPDEIIQRHHLMKFVDAMREVHFPRSLETAERARERLAFDEMFLMQLASSKRRSAWKEQQIGNAFKIKEFEKEIDKFVSSLPFTLTQAQDSATLEIFKDLSTDKAMNRLLQGDVGSGKTVVAAIAIYVAYLNGFQSVLMAPTEILAQQHFATVSRLLSPFGIKVDLVTGSKKLIPTVIPPKAGIQKRNGSRIKSGMTNKDTQDFHFDILVGTHAVLSEKIKFNKLGFVVIDEQQRFGVEQRSVIRQKGKNPHLLTMTATPIPRTVALTMYGDLDLSYLNEMPVGRKKVKTWLVPPEKRNAAYDWIRKQLQENDSQAFIICPFIEESESMQTVRAASKEYERLKHEVYPDLKLGLLHGKLKAKEKDEILQNFRNRKYDILVATPVVEVGIDIPNATIILIEAAERFGLSQLHQLRGRVGRGDKQSYCLLFTENKNMQTQTRLKAMESTYAGAELAELDLKLRGPGNMYGTAQHGVPKLKIASFSDTTLIQQAKHVSDEIFPQLNKYSKLEEKVNAISIRQVSPD